MLLPYIYIFISKTSHVHQQHRRLHLSQQPHPLLLIFPGSLKTSPLPQPVPSRRQPTNRDSLLPALIAQRLVRSPRRHREERESEIHSVRHTHSQIRSSQITPRGGSSRINRSLSSSRGNSSDALSLRELLQLKGILIVSRRWFLALAAL